MSIKGIGESKHIHNSVVKRNDGARYSEEPAGHCHGHSRIRSRWYGEGVIWAIEEDWLWGRSRAINSTWQPRKSIKPICDANRIDTLCPHLVIYPDVADVAIGGFPPTLE